MAATAEYLASGLARPPEEFALVPLWFWNGFGNSAILGEQLHRMREQGIGGAFIHARHGTHVPYMSPAWMSLVREAVSHGKAIGLKTWLYDEENWPSGSAGGRVNADPAFRGVFLLYDWFELEPGARFAIPPGLDPVSCQAMASNADGRRTFVDLLEDPDWRPVGSPAQVLVFHRRVNDRYIDVTNAAAVRRFIALTHERYRECLGDLWDNVPGIFMDEVCLLDVWNVARLHPNAFPWGGRFREEFEKRKGYDVRLLLDCLVLRARPGWRDVRRDYYEVLSELYIESFFKPVYEWCQANGIAFTGHVLFEEPFCDQIRQQVNTFPLYRYLHIPGVDNLGAVTRGIHHKVCASAAHHFGKRRVLSESFGAGGWGMSLADRKYCMDWQVTQGINFFTPHAVYQTIYGKRKREAAPSEFDCEPYWRFYHHFAQYAARLSFIASQGVHSAPLAVLYPSWSAIMEFNPEERSREFRMVEEGLHAVCEACSTLQYDFDLIDESIIEALAVSAGAIANHEEVHRAFVIPPVTTVSRASLSFIQKLAEHGVPMLLVGPVPEHLLEDGADETLSEKLAALMGKGLLAHMPHLDRQAFRDWLFRHVAADVRIEAEKVEGGADQVRVMSRKLQDGSVHFVVNQGVHELVAAVSFREPGRVCRIGLEDGRLTELPGSRVRCRFGPKEAAAFLVTPKHLGAEVGDSDSQPGKEIRLEGPWRVTAVDPNVAFLCGWHYLPLQDESLLDRMLCDLQGTGSNHAYPAAEPGRWRYFDSYVGVGWTPTLNEIERNPPPFVLYRKDFLVDGAVGRVGVILEPLDVPFRTFFNGSPCELSSSAFLDREFLEADVTARVRAGKNTLILCVDCRGAHPEEPHSLRRITCDIVPEPARLVGDFSFTDGTLSPLKPAVSRTGSCLGLGLDFLWGRVLMEAQFVIPPAERGRRYRLAFDEVRQIAEVAVNGQPAGVLLWKPYQIDVTDRVRAGLNSIALTISGYAGPSVAGKKMDFGISGCTMQVFP